MNRLVVASGSSGWMKTLFSRHSILNDELPAATCVTGSPSSITLRWFWVVPSRVILLRSGFCVSIFWPNAVRVAIAMSIKVRFMALTPSVNLSTSQEAYGRPGYPDLPVRRTTCRPPALASEPSASAWNQEAQASRPSLPPARTRTQRDESAEAGRDRRSGRPLLVTCMRKVSLSMICPWPSST